MSVITAEEIREIPRRYRIGKRPLSLMLGWGELTYTRLLDGNKPSEAHAAELRTLLDDPVAYVRALEMGRSRITEAAYSRSFAAVDEILADQGGALKAAKIFAVADRFCMLANGDLTPSALQRLVYYAQGFCLARLDSPLIGELPRAGASGPVYDRIYITYSSDGIRNACPVDGSAFHGGHAELPDSKISSAEASEALSAKELSVIDTVYEKYGSSSGQTLSKMSREEAPWRKARKRAGVADGADCDEIITAKSMKKFFSKIS